jgi:hypothetical protein
MPPKGPRRRPAPAGPQTPHVGLRPTRPIGAVRLEIARARPPGFSVPLDIAMRGDLELTGVLAASDPRGRLRLCLVDALDSQGGRPDGTWLALQRAAAPGVGAPYRLDRGGDSDSAGIRGECWVTVPARRRARVEECARELRGREVRLTVRPRPYAFISQATGGRVAGTSLSFVGGLELLAPEGQAGTRC